MTWDELVERTREALNESGGHLRAVSDLVATVGADDGFLAADEILVAFTLLGLAASNLHSAVEHLTIGLDAVVETLREASKSQEMKDG